MFIVKGKIKEYVHTGNEKFLRRGSPHFLPNTEVVLTHYYSSQYLFHHKLWVRGTHRSGSLKTRPIYFKFVKDLHLEEVKNPSPKTLEFIEKNHLFTTRKNAPYNEFSEVEKMIDFFKDIEQPEPEPGPIEDELFLAGQDFVTDLQRLLRKEDFEGLLAHLKFPLTVIKGGQFYPLTVSKEEFVQTHKAELMGRIGKTILDTDLNTIFPGLDRMILGLTEIEITKGNQFQITKIEIA